MIGRFSLSRLKAAMPSRPVAMTLAVTFITASLLTILTYSQVRNSERAAALTRLQRATQLYAQPIISALTRTEVDAEILINMPPIKGIQRALAVPGGRDPRDGSERDHWQDRLETIFSTVLEVNPHYTQIRYISLANGWQELVRVNQDREGIHRVRGDELQSKAGESYLADHRFRAAPDGFFSNLNYNRENGRATRAPTLRYVRPVYAPDGALFGAVVINTDFAALILAARPLADIGETVQIVTQAMDHLTVSQEDKSTPLRFHKDPQFKPPTAAELLKFQQNIGKVTETEGQLVYIDRIVSRDAAHPQELYVVSSLSLEASFAGSRQAIVFGEILAGVLALICAFFAGLLWQYMRQPLRKLLSSLEAGTGAGGDRDGPNTRQDDIGALEGAFHGLTRDLAAETSRYRTIVDGAGDGIVSITQEGLIVDVNPAIEALFGHDRAALLGQPVEILMDEVNAQDHKAHVEASSEKMVGKRMAGQRDIYGRRKDGSRVPLEITVSRVEEGEDTRFIGILRDISERKEAQDRLAQLIASLERSNGELDKFAYIASHDLKAPLRVIQNASQWLEEDLEGLLNDDTRESMNLLRSRVVRMEKLLDDLLQHSRIGRVDEGNETVTGPALVENISELIDLPKGMTLIFAPGFEGLSFGLMPLSMILINLVSNAIKHHDRADGKITVAVRVVKGGHEFTIEDDGPGIAPEYHGKIFDMFQTLKPRDQVDGSGMGLAMVRKYTDIAGGQVEVVSDGTRGTVFRLFWPGAQDSAKEGLAA